MAITADMKGLLAHAENCENFFGKEGEPETVIPKMSQEANSSPSIP
ncbi:MAG: hypothetical protein ACXWVI_01835 [Methyloceanibacter sp.]